MHVDMDAFFASIEQRNNPQLAGKPVIVASEPRNRGVVATCSYEARAYGIHSAMPTSQALRLCPKGIYVRGDFASYDFASVKVRSIFARFSPKVEVVSIDEAFLDLTGTERCEGSPQEVAQKIKLAILNEVGITCSVGIGPNKLVAKLASGLEKPDGLTIISQDEIKDRLYHLSVDKIWGVGPKTYQVMEKYGIRTVGDLAVLDKRALQTMMGNFGVCLGARARGADESDVLDEPSQPDEKSISHEFTLPLDTSDFTTIRSLILVLSEMVVIRMQRGKWLARTVALRLRFGDFETIIRQVTLPAPMDDLGLIFRTASSLVPIKPVALKKVRLVGVRVSNLIHRSQELQTDLFAGNSIQRRKRLEESINQLRDRFGEGIITHAGTMLFAAGK